MLVSKWRIGVSGRFDMREGAVFTIISRGFHDNFCHCQVDDQTLQSECPYCGEEATAAAAVGE